LAFRLNSINLKKKGEKRGGKKKERRGEKMEGSE